VSPNGIDVHPDAALWPMMPDDELEELAETIKTAGLQFPILLDSKGRLVDGRNRLKACEIAGVAPTFETVEGDDDEIGDLIDRVNARRRHITKGQRAMVAAMREQSRELPGCLEAVGLQRTKYATDLLSNARIVLKYTPDLAPKVRNGETPLDKAYQSAKLIKETLESADAVTARLRQESPRLAELVAEEELSLPAALAALDEEKRQAKQHRASLFEHIAKAIYLHEAIGSVENINDAAETLINHRSEFEAQERYALERLVVACEELPKALATLKQKLRRAKWPDQKTKGKANETKAPASS
jgi:DNA repair exonuclease SbcCD ATPase subunit